MAGRAPRAVRETEHKFRIHGLFRIPDLREVDGVARVDDQGIVGLTATYYDTRDLRLVREGVTLRRRYGGPDEGWHLKLPTGIEHTRDELQLPLSDDGPPAALTHIVTAITRHEPITPAASIRTSRHRQIIVGNSTRIAELVDDNVEVLGPQGNPTARFRELELELIDDDGTADRVIAALTGAGATEGTFVAKAVRALGPDAAEPPEVPQPAALEPSDAASTCIAAYFATHVRALRRADIGFRRSPEAPGDNVHQMRVAARRLRSGLRVFRPLLDPAWAKHLSDELAWFARNLTELRESEVLLPRLDAVIKNLIPDGAVDHGEGLHEIVHARVGGSLNRARSDALSMLASDRYLSLHDSLVTAAREPAVTSAADAPANVVFPQLVHKAWIKLEKAASHLSSDAPDTRWHDARLAAKRARYAGEAVAPALGHDAAAFAKQIEQLTEILGEHQDAVQAEAVALGLAGSADDNQQTLLGLGMMAGIERARAHAARDRFAQVWPKVSRPKWRRWIPDRGSAHG